MAWILLYIAGLLEVAWASSMKASNGFTHVGWSIFTGVTAFASFWLLALAMRDLPLGTAYAVWVGIGAVGAFIIGILFLGDTLSVQRVVAVSFVVIGLIGLKLTEGS